MASLAFEWWRLQWLGMGPNSHFQLSRSFNLPGIIHADLNDHNFLVSRPSEKEEWRVCGLLDFGDTSQGYLLVEVAIAMAHLMARCPNHGHTPPHLFAGHALAGYLSKVELFDSG